MYGAKTLLAALAFFAGVSFAPAQNANRFDLLITEIMADPTPVVGLPAAEYVEIKNVSGAPLMLAGWTLSDKTSTAVIRNPWVVQPDSAVILCASSNAAALAAFGKTIGVPSFPSLDNESDVLVLRSPQNRIIHAVSYSSDWYRDAGKRSGGWSLEMIDTNHPCGGKENWKESTDPLGGTPGRTNAANGTNPDAVPPQLKTAYALDSARLVLVFTESLDSASAAIVSNYNLPNDNFISAVPQAPLFEAVQLTLAAPLQQGTVYTITVQGLSDCSGNPVGAYKRVRVGLPQAAGKNDVVINEIMFHPRPGGSDYIEVYNRSRKIIDVSSLFLGNRNGSGAVASLKRFSGTPFYLFPADYLALTAGKAAVQLQYLVKNPDAVLQLASLPSFPGDQGRAVVQNSVGEILDELSYSKDWQFALIANDEGVALERIDPEEPSQQKNNWHSASSAAGYGTPGYQNSQYRRRDLSTAGIAVSPAVFSPDNDGRDDLATISYRLAENGFVANVFIFDARGRLARQLVKNDLLATKGTWTWDGLDEKHQPLPVGVYIVVTELFNLEGKKESFKHSIVLARRLN